MKTSLTRIAMIALSVLLAQLAVAQRPPSPVQGTLAIPDTKVLPGVPFDMWIELRNTSDAAADLRSLISTEKNTELTSSLRTIPAFAPTRCWRIPF